MIKDVLEKYSKMKKAAKEFSVTSEDITEFFELIEGYATVGLELVTKTAKESELAAVRNFLLSSICAIKGVEGDMSLILAEKNGALTSYTDTVIFAMIGILYEEGAL